MPSYIYDIILLLTSRYNKTSITACVIPSVAIRCNLLHNVSDLGQIQFMNGICSIFIRNENAYLYIDYLYKNNTIKKCFLK